MRCMKIIKIIKIIFDKFDGKVVRQDWSVLVVRGEPASV